MVMRRNELHLQLVKNEIRRLVGEYPSLLPVLKMKKKYRQVIVSKDTDIVIEGAGGCGNSFAVVAFQYAQKHPIKIAHHVHLPAQVLLGLKYNKPILIIVRDPADAVVSLVSRRMLMNSRLTIEQALKDYISFYKRIMCYRDEIFIANFEEVISDYGKVIGDLNRWYNTSFLKFDHSEENVRRVLEILLLAKPQPEREKVKKRLKEKMYLETRLRNLLDRGIDLYSQFVTR